MNKNFKRRDDIVFGDGRQSPEQLSESFQIDREKMCSILKQLRDHYPIFYIFQEHGLDYDKLVSIQLASGIRHYVGGIALFDFLTIGQIDQLIEEDFFDPEDLDLQSGYPVKKFVEFLRKFPQCCANGYVVDVERDDYRVSLTGIECYKDITPELNRSFHKIFKDASERQFNEGYLRCWYD